MIPQYPPPKPPLPPNPPNTPVLQPKPRIASQTQSMLFPALLAEADPDSLPSSRNVTPPVDEKVNAYLAGLRQAEEARATPPMFSGGDVVSAPLPPAVEALRKSNATPDSISQPEVPSQTNIARWTPPPVHPSRAAASIQVPGPAILAESQPQTKVRSRTPPPSHTSRNVGAFAREQEAPLATSAKQEVRSDVVEPAKEFTGSKDDLIRGLPVNRKPEEQVATTRRVEALALDAPKGSSSSGKVSDNVGMPRATEIEEMKAKEEYSNPGEPRRGTHERVSPSNHALTSSEPSRAPPPAQSEFVGAKVASSTTEPTPAVKQTVDRKHEPTRAPEPAHSSNNPPYAKLFTSVPRPSEAPRTQAIPDNAPAYDEDRTATRPQAQRRPSDKIPPLTQSAEPVTMGVPQRDQKRETSDAHPPAHVQAPVYEQPSAAPVDSHSKPHTNWREALDRAMRTNHVQDTPVVHATAAAPVIPASVDRAGPARFPYVETEVEATPEQAVPDKPASFATPGKWAGQELRAAEVRAFHVVPHFVAVHEYDIACERC